jgi:hypothetical protein
MKTGSVAPGQSIAGECVKMANLPPHEDPSKHIDGHKCVIRQTKGYRRVPGDTCTGGNQWDPVEVYECPPTGGGGKIILFILVVLIVGWALFQFSNKYNDGSEKFCDRFRKWCPKVDGYRILDGRFDREIDTAEEDFLDQDEPSASLIRGDRDSEPKRLARESFSADLESGSGPNKKSKNKKSKNKDSSSAIQVQFRGLPGSKQSSKDVQLPPILPPPGGASI